MYASDLLLCSENHVWLMAVSGYPEDELRLAAQSVSRSVGEERSDSSIMQRLRKEKNAMRTGTGISAEQRSMTVKGRLINNPNETESRDT